MRTISLLTAVLGALVVAPVATAKPSIVPGVYRGRADPGGGVVVKVSRGGAVSLHAMIDEACGSSADPFTPPKGYTQRDAVSAGPSEVRVRGTAFRYSYQEESSPMEGGDGIAEGAKGTFTGKSVTGKVRSSDSWDSSFGGGGFGACSGVATFSARRMP